MYSDDSNSKKSNEKTLKEFLYSLYPDEEGEKTQAYNVLFQFFQDILVKSILSPTFEVVLRVLFYIALDFFIVFSVPSVPWFKYFFPDREPLTFSYISSKISLQVVSSLMIILNLNMILIQWFIFMQYDPIKHLSTSAATFLHISFYYLPPIQSLLLGFIFGCLLVLNSFSEMTNAYCTFLSLLISVVFILISVNYYIYCIFTRYSIIIRRGFFATWEPPYSIISFAIFFLISAAFPFVTSSFRKTCTLFCIVTLLWSLSTIYRRQRPVYISSIAYFIEAKVAFDGILYSSLLLINIWVNIEFHHTTILMQILFFISLFVAGIMTSSSYSLLCSSILDDGNFNQANFPNSNACIMAIRVSLYFSVTNLFQKVDFLKWMLRNRFSSEIVPEIVRLNFVLNMDLIDSPIQSSSYSPLELISLKFLSFQVRQYEKFVLSSPDHPSISCAIEEMKRLMQIVNNVSKVFWTNRDYEQLTICEYGKKISRISSFMKNLAISYPHSNEIQTLWNEYSKSIIQKPSKTIIKHVHEFTYIENPGNSVYYFLNQALPEDFEIRNQKRIDSTTEHFVSTFVDAAFNPICRFYLIVPLLIFLIGIAFAAMFAFRSHKVYNLYADNMKILTLSISLCIDSLNQADRFVQLPSNSFISKMLHISIDAASSFRNDILIIDPTYDKMSNFLGLFDQYEINVNISRCPRFTLGYMIIFDFQNDDININQCHLLWAAAYSRKLAEIAQQNIEDFYPFFSTLLNDNKTIGLDEMQGIFIAVSNVIFIIVFIILTLKQRKIIKKLIMSIENIVAMNNDICQRGEPYIGFSAFIYAILMILLTAVLSLYYIVYIFPIRKTEEQMKKIANQTLLLSNVCRFTTLAMASSIIEIGLKQSLSTDQGTTIEMMNDYGYSTIFDDEEEMKKLVNSIKELSSLRKLFVANLIANANQLTLSDIDPIIRSASNWIPDSSTFLSTQELIKSKNSLLLNKTIRECSSSTENSMTEVFKTSNIEKVSKSNEPKSCGFIEITQNNTIKLTNFEDINDCGYPIQKNQQISAFNNDLIRQKSFLSSMFDLISDCVYEFSSEIDFEAATMTSLSSIVIDFAQLLEEDNLTASSFNYLMARLMYKVNISSLLTKAFPEIDSLNPIIFKYLDEPYWIYFVVNTFLLIIVSHFLYFHIRGQKSWFLGISVLIRRAMAKYPERFLFIVGVILEDKPKYFDVLPIPIIILNKKGTILYANQVVMQYTKHTMDQTIGQPCNEFFTENSTKYTDLTFSTEKRSFVNLSKKKERKKKINESENESDSLEDIGSVVVDPENSFDFIILRDTSKCLELQKTLNDLKERVTPEVGQIPSRGRLIFIECRFQTESVKPDVVFSKIESVASKYKLIKSEKKLDRIKKSFLQNKKIVKTSKENSSKDDDDDNDDESVNNSDDEDENDFDDVVVDADFDGKLMKIDHVGFFDFKDDDDILNDRCVTIISCGCSYLTAIARIGCEEEAIRFVLELSSDIFMNFKASITEGVGTVLGVLDGSSLVVVAGNVSRRATDANLAGLWGRIYIDYSIIERSGMEKELQNDDLDKPNDKNGSDNSNENKNLNAGKKLNENNNLNAKSTLNGNDSLMPPQKFPGLQPTLSAGPATPKPPAQQNNPPGGMFGLAKFGLGFGLNKPASSAATLNLKKSLIIQISPLSKV